MTSPFNTFDDAADPRLLANLDENFAMFSDTSDSTLNAGLVAHDASLTYPPGTVGDDVNQALEAIKTLQGDGTAITVTPDSTGTVLTISLLSTAAGVSLTLSSTLTAATVGVAGTLTAATVNAANCDISGSLAATTVGVSGTLTAATINVNTLASTTMGVSGTFTAATVNAGTLGATTATIGTLDANTLLKGKGDTTGSAAAAGYIGEYVESVAGPTTLTTATGAALASITLTAGDWLVGGAVQFVGDGSAKVSTMAGGIGNTSGTLPGINYRGGWLGSAATALPSTVAFGGAVPNRVFNVSGSATLYLNALAGFASGACSGYGWVWARRMR